MVVLWSETEWLELKNEVCRSLQEFLEKRGGCSVKENKHELAFQLYKSLGSDRSCGKVAELMNLREKTIQNWSYQDKWQERLDREYGEVAADIKAKYEKLENLGIDVALAVMERIKGEVDKGVVLTKDLASIYKDFLSCPLSLIGTGETVGTQPVGVNNNGGVNVNLYLSEEDGVGVND